MSASAACPASVHACAVVVGEVCVLIRGPSGAGKSAATMALIELAKMRGQFARLVADDRVRLETRGGRLVASPHPAIAGRIERRGQGIGAAPHLPRAVVALVVDLVGADAPRLPEPGELWTQIEGLRVPRLALRGAPIEIAAATLARLRRRTGDLAPP